MSPATLIEATEFIMRQQFQYPGDTIVDRTKARRIVIPGSDQVINRAMDTIASETNLSLWENGKREEFLKRASNFFGISSEKVIDRALKKLETLVDASVGPVVEYMTALGVVVSIFRGSVNNDLIEKMLQEKSLSSSQEEKLRDDLHVDESLLANIAVLQRLSEITGIDISPRYLKLEITAVLKRVKD